MKLHEAIALVLKENNRSMLAKEIANEINGRKLYQRGDRTSVPTSQIHARVNNYPSMFKKTANGEITLVTSSARIKTSAKQSHSTKNKPVKNSNDKKNSLTIENFRTYRDRTTIELAPITILTGRNNACKSTIFKALLLLSDYLNSNNQTILEFDGPSAHKHKIDCIENALTWGSSEKYVSFEYEKNKNLLYSNSSP
jgi:hypothetical protein